MKNIYVVLLSLITMGSYGQQYAVDVILNKTSTDQSLNLDALFDHLNTNYDGCLEFIRVDRFNNAQSPYTLEIWDTPFTIGTKILRETRIKEVVNKNNQKQEKRYVFNGFQTRTNYHLNFRLIETQSRSVLDVFNLSGTFLLDEESEIVQESWPSASGKSTIEYKKAIKEIEDIIFDEYPEVPDNLESQARDKIKSAFTNVIKIRLSHALLPPLYVSETAKVKGDKVKEVIYEGCNDIDVTGFGMFYYPFLSNKKVGDFDAYTQISKGYVNSKDETSKVLGVRKNEKELLVAMNNNEEIIIADVENLPQRNLNANKDEELIDLSILLTYENSSAFTSFDKKSLLLLFQAHFLNYSNMRVIAYDTMINNDSETNEKISNTIINVHISDMLDTKKINKAKKGLSKFLKEEDKDLGNPRDRFMYATLSLALDDDIYEDKIELQGFYTKNVLQIVSSTLNFESINQAIIDDSVVIIETDKVEKDKVKTLYVRSFAPMQDGKKYKFYDTPNIGKKTKSLAEIKIKDVLSSYLGLAEVKDGDKNLYKALNSDQDLYSKINTGGFFGSDGFKNSFKGYISVSKPDYRVYDYNRKR